MKKSVKICLVKNKRDRRYYRCFTSNAIVPLWIFILFSMVGCEIYSDVLIKPEYQPSLAIHAILSPQEGGQVYIKYTKPVDSTNAQPVPILPKLSVALYENGAKKYTFTEPEKGHFVLDTAGMEILPNHDYHLEVENRDGKTILKSGNERLPSLPDVTATRFYQDTITFPEKNYIDVEFNLTPGSKTAYHFRKDYSIDSGQVFIRGHDAQYGRFSVGGLVHSADYPNGVIKETLTASVFVRPKPGNDNQYVDAVKLWVDHLSPALTLFLQDVAEAREAYGDPFATQSPVYTNIEGGYGIFGMYNSWVDVLFME